MNVPEHVLDIFLQPGDFYWGDSATRIRTILGSCISICLWHPILKEGGMCHYMMPSRGVNNVPPPGRIDGRYADEAWELFMIELKKNKTKPSDYVVKIFGGSSMFLERDDLYLRETTAKYNIGMRNIEKARDIIHKNNLNVVSENLGGTKSRRIHFEVWTGNVWLKRMDS